ncbi:MAG: efflux RND transporter permease subunit [Rhodospirillaceae bacterium]|nr:efflux RND transporter permease subunit [Rhodospirillaceae bacterium]
MNLIGLSIHRPIAVIAAVLMVVMFGYVSLQTIPIQLTPDVNRPVIQISTSWPGAAPAEVEREILNRQEEVLRGLEGVEEIVGEASRGNADITLTFAISTNMDRALLLTANRLDRVNGYPDEADEPTIRTADVNGSAIAWFALTRLPGVDDPIESFGPFVEDYIEARLERVPGVAEVNVYGGSDREMQVVVEPELMARYRLTVPEVVTALRAANVSLTAGDVDEGKRRYTVRTDGEFTSPDQVRAVLIRTLEDPDSGTIGRVTVGDIANVQFAFQEPSARIRHMGEPALVLNALRETGANVIEVMAGIQAAVDQLNAGLIPDHGLRVEQVYDETVYINSAVDLVQSNIIVGGTLAALVLMIFLRSWRATLVVSLAIPVSVVGSFVAMAALGRSINVISLAGLAFAVGMVVDAAIVVLENIFRLRQAGMSAPKAAYEGARQVWGAVLVSALTTVMVFIPILTMNLVVGQLFRDIAVAISVSVLLSLVVAITVIPALSARLLSREKVGEDAKPVRLPGIDAFGRGFVAGVRALTHRIVHSRGLALSTVAATAGIAMMVAYLLLPQLEYLPSGNRNFVFGRILPPPGYNLAASVEIAEAVEDAVRAHWVDRDGAGRVPEEPVMSRFFFVARPNSNFVGAAAEDPNEAGALIPILSEPIFAEPGTVGFMGQASLFGRGVGGARSIDLDISGPDLESLFAVARDAAGLVAEALPRDQGNQVRPLPALTLGAPEVRVIPDPLRLADNGVTAATLGTTVDAFNDGLRVAEITVDGERIDLTLMGPLDMIGETQGIGAIPVVNGAGQIIPVDSLADVEVTSGPTEIRHSERERTVTLRILPGPGLPLQAALDTVEEQVIAPLEAEGLPGGVVLGLSGTADQLERTWNHMVLDLLLALVIVYLVMAVLFESFAYPLIIMISVPVAAAGGVLGLWILNMFYEQPLDMLTLLGFVILIGIVVNNAILLVHQSLYHFRTDRMTVQQAIAEATNNRVRPIFMSTLTSVFGMLPLVLFPGAGSELYRGLGSVVLGGLSLSAVLTLLVIPPLMTVFMGVIESHHPAPADEAVAEPAVPSARPEAAE